MNKPKVLWKRLSTTAITPRKGYPGDVAYDLFADHSAIVGARATLIQTNIAAAIPEGYGGLLMGRSKLATRSITPLAFVLMDATGRLRLGGCIDPSYRGPIGFIVASIGGTGNDPVRPGDAVAQMWILPIPDLDDEDIGDGDLPPGIRGERGFGSTDPVRPTGIVNVGGWGQEGWQMSRAEIEGKEPPKAFSIPSFWAGPTTRFDREHFERLYQGTWPTPNPDNPPVDIRGVNAPPPGPFVQLVGRASRPLKELSNIMGVREMAENPKWIIEAHNLDRKGQGLGPLVENAKLTAAAMLHAREMASRRVMSHTGGDGSTVATRINREGYRWSRAGENIAAGYRDVASVMKGWINSSGHRANIRGAFREMGVGIATARDGTLYWCTVFATARSGSITEFTTDRGGGSDTPGQDEESIERDLLIHAPEGIVERPERPVDEPTSVPTSDPTPNPPDASTGLLDAPGPGGNEEYFRRVLETFQSGSPVIIAPGARAEPLSDYRQRVAKACEVAGIECWAHEIPDRPDLDPDQYDRAMESAFADIIWRHVSGAMVIPEPPSPIVLTTIPTADPGTPPDLE